MNLEDRIDAVLPQTQCRKCGYAGCRPYARAIAAGESDINRCPPGGEAGIRELAGLLGRPFKPLDPEVGAAQPPAVAIIDEELCVGCTLCIQACPVDAIVGSSKQMHTVISALCTGCELCLPPCPVDCIRMEPAGTPGRDRAAADAARRRFEMRNARLARDRREKAERLAQKAASARAAAAQADTSGADEKKALIAAAMARALAQRNSVQPKNADNLTPQQQAEIAAIEARRRRES